MIRRIPTGTVATALSGPPATRRPACILASPLPDSARSTLGKLGSPYQGHPHWLKLPGVEVSTGSLGQGLSIGVGMALVGKLNNRSHKVFCIMGDGEQQEGQVWEAAMEAGHYKLDNRIGIIDCNRLPD